LPSPAVLKRHKCTPVGSKRVSWSEMGAGTIG
jgi:hypothetical protein